MLLKPNFLAFWKVEKNTVNFFFFYEERGKGG